MERLDKLIASRTGYSRREVQKLVRCGSVLLNSRPALTADTKVDPQTDQVTVQGRPIQRGVWTRTRKALSSSQTTDSLPIVFSRPAVMCLKPISWRWMVPFHLQLHRTLRTAWPLKVGSAVCLPPWRLGRQEIRAW